MLFAIKAAIKPGEILDLTNEDTIKSIYKKIKLIFFHPYSYLGGADNSLLRLIQKLDLNEFSVNENTFNPLKNIYLLIIKILDFKFDWKGTKDI